MYLFRNCADVERAFVKRDRRSGIATALVVIPEISHSADELTLQTFTRLDGVRPAVVSEEWTSVQLQRRRELRWRRDSCEHALEFPRVHPDQCGSSFTPSAEKLNASR